MNSFQKISLILGLILICLSPWIFTRSSFVGFDFTTTGQIGDTIGGITAPIVNLIGAFLVYLSFKQQLIANQNQKQDLLNEIKRSNESKKYDSIVHDIDSLKIDIENFSYNSGSGESFKSYKGMNAISKFTRQIEYLNRTGANDKVQIEFGDVTFHNFYFLNSYCLNILLNIKNSRIENEFLKEQLNEKFTAWY